jgi:hypothetical protein
MERARQGGERQREGGKEGERGEEKAPERKYQITLTE